MKDFGKAILNRLLDKYENSVLSKGGSERKISISLSIKDKELETYRVADSYNYRDRNDAVLADYIQKAFITAKRDKYGDIQFLFLNLDSVDVIYTYLSRSNPRQEVEKVLKTLKGNTCTGYIQNFVLYCKDWIEKNYSIPKNYFDSNKNLKDLLKGLNAISHLSKVIRIRDFSVKVYGDSKYFDGLKNKIAKIILEFDPNCDIEKSDLEFVDHVLSENNIIQNSSYAMVKSGLIIQINQTVINLDKLGYEFCLSDEMIDSLKIVGVEAKKLITIENLTTFYQFKEPNAIILYLGGFHNHTKRLLIKKIAEQCPNLEFYHYGDIDAGGLYILEHLRRKTGIVFQPLHMDITTLKQYQPYWKELTENDIKRLKNIDSEEFAPLISYMLYNNCKLEQESAELE